MSVGISSLDRTIRRIGRRYRRLLYGTGRVRVMSGSISGRGGTLYGHSNFGPRDLDKDRNEDFVLLWAPSPGAPRSSPDWAVAVADGVTSSYRSDLASELACWSSLASVVRSTAKEMPSDTGLNAIHSAAASLRAAGRMFGSHAAQWRPADEFASAWAYRLASGVFLQTTLTVAWCRRDDVHLVRVGDGGATLLEPTEPGSPGRVQSLFDVDTETHAVQAIGPVVSGCILPSDQLSLSLPHGSVLAIYTDGVGRHVQQQPLALFERFEKVCGHHSDTEKMAGSVIQQLLASDAESLQDNLSLVFATRKQR